MNTRQLSAVCSATTQLGYLCSHRAMEGSSHCYAHDDRYASERRRHAQKGGRLGGRGRASISKELGEVRRIIGAVVELKAQNRLPIHLDCYMKDFISLLKLYLTYTQLEVRTAKDEDLQSKRAFDKEHLIDTEQIREDLEALVHDHEGGHLEDPDSVPQFTSVEDVREHIEDMMRVHEGEHPDDAA